MVSIIQAHPFVATFAAVVGSAALYWRAVYAISRFMDRFESPARPHRGGEL